MPTLFIIFGFKKNELRMIESIIEENQAVIEERWDEYFKKQSQNPTPSGVE